MKGLLIKDLRILLRQKTTFLIIILLGVFLGTNGGNISFSMGYMMFVSATLTITTISYDYFEKGMSFLLTLPVTKKMYVVEKYVMAVLIGLAVALVGCLLNFIGGFFGALAPWNEFAITVVTTLAAAMLMIALYIPVYIKCGPEKSRVAILIVIGAIAAVGYLAYLLLKVEVVQKTLLPVIGVLENMTAIQFASVGVVLWVVLMTVSVVASIRILEKKEF
jgi:hypothetical protein